MTNLSTPVGRLKPTTAVTLVVAMYARYSSDQQRQTSIDDQLRRCREIAVSKGFSVENAQVYTDSALSGTAKHQEKRLGYQALIADWNAGKIDVIIVDEYSRLTRNGVESAQLCERLEQNKRVRLITAEGIDSSIPGWQLQLGLTSVLNQQEVRSISHRVPRGMLGQLTRGHMIACPPYGYDLQRVFNAQGERTATDWAINEKEAAIVRDIFARRERGQSMHRIARHLNDEGIATRRKSKKFEVGIWRPAAIRNLLSNTIYRGVFTWHGSTTIRYRARKTGETVETQAFPRPELRLVSDETWARCNSNSVSRSGYGGGKHCLAGIVTCGHCGATLVLSSQSRCRSLYCSTCTSTKAATASTEHQTVSVAAVGVQQLLTEAMTHFLTPVFIEAFRGSLRAKLIGNADQDIENCRKQLAKLQRSQETLSRMIANADDEDPILVARYEDNRQKLRDLRTQFDTLTAGQIRVDESAIAAQLEIDPSTLLHHLFDGHVAPEQTRATLARLFPQIVLDGKTAKYTSCWRIQFSPGTAMAMVSETPTVCTDVSELRFMLRYRTDHRSSQHENRWVVTPLPSPSTPAAAPHLE